MKKISLRVTNYHSQEVEKMVNEEVADIKVHARNLGSSYAERNLPKENVIKLVLVIGEIKARNEKLCISVCKELQSAIHQPEIATDRMNVDAGNKKGYDAINELKYKKQQLETEQKKLNIEAIYQNIREIRIKLFLFFIAEAFLTAMSFQFYGENLLVSFLIALPITLAVSEFAHLVAMHYKKTENALKRKLFLVASIIMVTILFIGLSYFRTLAIGKQGAFLSTLFFVIVNLFIFLVSAFLHFKYSLSKEEKIKYHTHKRLKIEIEKIDVEIQQIEKEMGEMNIQLYDKALLALHLEHYAKNTIEEIQKHYEEAVEIFKSTNIFLRTDNIFPECFSEETPRLEVNYDFHLYQRYDVQK